MLSELAVSLRGTIPAASSGQHAQIVYMSLDRLDYFGVMVSHGLKHHSTLMSTGFLMVVSARLYQPAALHSIVHGISQWIQGGAHSQLFKHEREACHLQVRQLGPVLTAEGFHRIYITNVEQLKCSCMLQWLALDCRQAVTSSNIKMPA